MMPVAPDCTIRLQMIYICIFIDDADSGTLRKWRFKGLFDQAEIKVLAYIHHLMSVQ